MREFFHGWQRKTGLILLVIASACAAMWVRSYANADTLAFPANHRQHLIFSVNGVITWIHWKSKGDFWTDSVKRSHSSFDHIELTMQTLDHDGWLECPYWLIVCPLIPVSASLILRKPRNRDGQPLARRTAQT